jgi:hypothetical protein
MTRISPEALKGMRMISTNWDEDASCPACHGPVKVGEDVLYGRHLTCARSRASARETAETSDEVLDLARRRLAVPGHITFTRTQLRMLVDAARDSGTELVRRPDAGHRCQWYGRMRGWSADRVAAGLSAPEVAGMWADFLDIGRLPPVRHADLQALLDAIPACVS